MPAARDSFIYFSMGSLSRWDTLKRQLEGKGAPGRQFMAQSYYLWSGSDRALLLQTTCLRSIILWDVTQFWGFINRWIPWWWSRRDYRLQTGRKTVGQDSIQQFHKLRYLLCLCSQSKPSMMDECLESKTKKVTVSRWLPEMIRVNGLVQWVMGGKGLPLRSVVSRGFLIGIDSILCWWIMDWEMRVCSQPQSTKALIWNEYYWKNCVAGRKNREMWCMWACSLDSP